MACLFTSLLDYLFIWLCWVFVTTWRLPLALVSWGYSSLQCTGFSLLWLLLFWSTGSRHAGFSSCNTQAQYLCLQAQYLCLASSVLVSCRLSHRGAWAQLLQSHGIFLDQGLNLCPMHWQANSHPLFYEGSPPVYFIMKHFDEQNFLISMKSNFLLWLLFSVYFVRKLCLPPKSKRYFLVFTPGRLIVLAFTFMSRIHFHLILHKM